MPPSFRPPLLRTPRATVLILAAITAAAQPSLLAATAPGELVNISVRTRVGSGDSVLIAGFVVSGAGERPLLVRGVGPTLGGVPFNVPSVLADPHVSLFRDNVLVLENNDWSDASTLTAAFDRLGAFRLTAGSLDAALLTPVSQGVYTAIARSNNATAGDLLLEVYDAIEPGATGPAISNLSLRADLPAAATMVTGFVVNGTAPKRLLIRAIGPSLERFGVENFLNDPRVRLFTGETDVAVNDNWTDASNAEVIADTSRAVGAFELTRDTADAAVLTTLQPGAYTLHVTGRESDDHGVVLVEVYGADPVLAEPAPTEPPPAQSGLPRISVYASDEDASESGADTGRIHFHRSGALDAPLTIDVQWSGTATPGIDCQALPSQITFAAGVFETSVEIIPTVDTTIEAPESVVAAVEHADTYAAAEANTSGVLIADAPYAGAPGWRAEFFNNMGFTGSPVLTRTDAAIDFDWESQSPGSNVRADRFSVRWTGVIVPPATADYTFVVSGDDTIRLNIGGRLVLDRSYTWQETAVIVPLTGGVPQVVTFELVEEWGWASAHLWWSGGGMGSHAVTEVAPVTTAPAAATGLDRTVAILGEPFVGFVQSTGSPTSFSAAGLPPGLAINPQSGVISGTPTAAGTFLVWLHAHNATGAGSAKILLEVIATEGHATHEVFTGTGGGVSVPFGATPLSVDTASAGELTTSADGQVHRIRGYLTAPETGAYRFWLSASGPAELRLADSDEPGDKVVRARVAGATAWREWNREPGQAAAPIHLEAGARHYFEIVHATAAGAGHVSLGWMRPGQTGALPFEVVPGYVLSPYAADAALEDGSTVFLANLRPAGVVQTGGFGVASLVLSPDEISATVAMRFGGLTSAATNIQIYHGGPDAAGDMPVRALPREPFADHSWNLAPVGTLTVPDILDALRGGQLFVLVQTGDHPGGELRGQFGPALGSAEFQPPAAPVYPDSSGLPSGTMTDEDAARFLNQATFGATMADIAHLREVGIDTWLNEQFVAPRSTLLPYIQAERRRRQAEDPEADVWTDALTESWWRTVVDGPDQLRQRVAFALSEIFVVSAESNLGGEIDALAIYYDLLSSHAFGNVRELLRDVTLSPAMGVYLSMVRNQKPDPANGIYPDENYAREVMQLFSIGLNKLHPDGTLVLDSHGLPIPTYGQETIVGLAHVFTGWSFASDDPEYNFSWGEPDFTRPMGFYPDYHDEQPKRLLESEILPVGRSGPAELEYVLDLLFHHPNTAPFLSRLLIQRLVTSNPSPGYVHRVATVFADNGQGARGDLRAVVRTILTDYEARSTEVAALQTFGKLREPLLRVAHLWRAFDATASGGNFDFSWTANWLGQEVLQSPTVFNFFQPDYIAPGPTADAGLVAPEFQIASDSNLANLINVLDWFAWRPVEWSDDPVLNLTAEAALVSNPDALLDRLDLLMLSGAMTTELRERLRTLLTTLPGWYDADDRVRAVVFTLITSPDYAIQK